MTSTETESSPVSDIAQAKPSLLAHVLSARESILNKGCLKQNVNDVVDSMATSDGAGAQTKKMIEALTVKATLGLAAAVTAGEQVAAGAGECVAAAAPPALANSKKRERKPAASIQKGRCAGDVYSPERTSPGGLPGTEWGCRRNG